MGSRYAEGIPQNVMLDYRTLQYIQPSIFSAVSNPMLISLLYIIFKNCDDYPDKCPHICVVVLIFLPF